MSEDDINNHPDYCRATWMLDKQIDTVYDLLRFWMLAGPHKGRYPQIERVTPWFHGFDSIIPM